jgi:glycosyltransferase involved in cell wall biosynthesis
MTRVAENASGSTSMQCIVITRFAREQPGYLDFSYRIRALATQFEVTVVSDAPLSQPELLYGPVEYVVLPAGDGRLEWLRYLWLCSRLIRARRPACTVLLHSLVAPIAMMAGGVPAALYWNEHPSHFAQSSPSLAPIKRAARRMVRWLVFEGARKATLVMPIGEAHYEDLLAHGCDTRRVKLIYMGVDPSFVPTGPGPHADGTHGPLELIYTGTVSRERGRDVMLEAMKIVNRRTTIARLTMIGAAPDELAYCLDYARRHGLVDTVQLHGRMVGSAIPCFLSRADAGLCLWEDRPWWRFNPPTKLFEYLVAGLPVLASDICTHTLYISDWHNGLIFNYDSHSLADAIHALWERRAKLPQLKQGARDSGRQYLWDRIEPSFLKCIQDIACS